MLHTILFQTFDEAKLCESLKKNVSKSGYVKPTPVQKHGIPIIFAGRDLMACAQTGSGKTVRGGTADVQVFFVLVLNGVSLPPGCISVAHFAAADGRRCSSQ